MVENADQLGPVWTKAKDPRITANAEAEEDIIAVLKKRAKNSSLGFDSVKIVSGEKGPFMLTPFLINLLIIGLSMVISS